MLSLEIFNFDTIFYLCLILGSLRMLFLVSIIVQNNIAKPM